MSYLSSIAGITEDDVAKVKMSADMTAALAGVASSLQNSGGVASWFAGDNTLDGFGTNLEVFGGALKSYSVSVSDLQIEAIEKSVDAAKNIINLTALEFQGMSSLSTNLNSLSKSLKSYTELDSTKLTSVTEEIESLVTLSGSMAGSDFSGLTALTNALGDAGENGVERFITAFDGVDEKTDSIGTKMMESLVKAIEKNNYHGVKSKGETFVTKLKKGIEEFKSDVKDECKTMVSDAVTAIEEYYQSFYDAGEYLVKGFIAGISDWIDNAADKAAAMAAAALEAAKAELREHSPSKAFYDIGAYAGEGFVNALDDYSSVSYEAGAGIAASAEKGLANTLSTLWKWTADQGISWGLEDIEPTITPVVDLSNVQSGADDIQSLLSSSMDGALSSVGDISTTMSSNSQNGSDSLLAKAIDKLSDKLDKTGNTTNIIEGITYDDGSGVSKAIQSIMRVAKVERRV